jgi:hypothetical protein
LGIRATRVKAAIDADEIHANELRDARRAAYTNYAENVERMKWRIIAAMNCAIDGDDDGFRDFAAIRNGMVGDICRHRIIAILAGPRLIETHLYALDDALFGLLGALEDGAERKGVSDLEAHLTPAMIQLDDERLKFLRQAQAVLGAT